MIPRPPGVFCLEGEWDDSIESRLSIEPALRVLEAHQTIRLVHRDVATVGELEYYLDRWLTTRHRGYDFGYFGFHGSSSSISIGNDNVSLDDLANMLKGRCTGKILHFGACGVLKAEDSMLSSFCRKTGARAVSGYTRDVDWVESAAFELIVVSKLAWSKNMKPAYHSLRKDYPDLTERLGFRMAHSTWASDRTIAVKAAENKQ